MYRRGRLLFWAQAKSQAWPWRRPWNTAWPVRPVSCIGNLPKARRTARVPSCAGCWPGMRAPLQAKKRTKPSPRCKHTRPCVSLCMPWVWPTKCCAGHPQRSRCRRCKLSCPGCPSWQACCRKRVLNPEGRAGAAATAANQGASTAASPSCWPSAHSLRADEVLREIAAMNGSGISPCTNLPAGDSCRTSVITSCEESPAGRLLHHS